MVSSGKKNEAAEYLRKLMFDYVSLSLAYLPNVYLHRYQAKNFIVLHEHVV